MIHLMLRNPHFVALRYGSTAPGSKLALTSNGSHTKPGGESDFEGLSARQAGTLG